MSFTRDKRAAQTAFSTLAEIREMLPSEPRARFDKALEAVRRYNADLRQRGGKGPASPLQPSLNVNAELAAGLRREVERLKTQYRDKCAELDRERSRDACELMTARYPSFHDRLSGLLAQLNEGERPKAGEMAIELLVHSLHPEDRLEDQDLRLQLCKFQLLLAQEQAIIRILSFHFGIDDKDAIYLRLMSRWCLAESREQMVIALVEFCDAYRGGRWEEGARAYVCAGLVLREFTASHPYLSITEYRYAHAAAMQACDIPFTYCALDPVLAAKVSVILAEHGDAIHLEVEDIILDALTAPPPQTSTEHQDR